MSGSILSSTAANATSTASAISQTGTTALGQLSSNFTDFLSLLMTQMQNQDPSSPMDSNTFTTELVQFSGVEQQISTNTDLTQLIQLGQANQIEQSASMLGKPVTATSSQLSLQNGSAAVNFNTTSAEPIGIAIYNSSGAQVQTASLTSVAGANTWTWNGQSATGATMPDGAYKVSVIGTDATGSSAAVPFTITGKATSVQNNSGTVQVQMGGLTLPFSAVNSVGG